MRIALALTIIGVLAPHAYASSKQDRRQTFAYEITFTNLSGGQIVSPLTVYTHSVQTLPLFAGGEPASEAVAAVAEDANATALQDSLKSDAQVGTIVTLRGANGPILPGEMARVKLTTVAPFDRLSLIGMLVTTNDAFVALTGVQLRGRDPAIFKGIAYDAGTEANTESCQHIPGPPCGNGGVRVAGSAEGFVHVHTGIHGVGDLDPAVYDWNNPVAQITVQRVRRD